MFERKAFNFYRSYYEIAQELEGSDRLAFYDAILKRQFTGEDTQLSGMARFAYLSQRHSIDEQVNSFLNGTKGGRPSSKPKQIPDANPKVYGTKQKMHFAVRSNYLHESPCIVYPDGLQQYFEENQFGFRFIKEYMAEIFWKENNGKMFNDHTHVNNVLLKFNQQQ